MAIVEVKGLIKDLKPYIEDKGKIVFTLTENEHRPSPSGEMVPVQNNFFIAVEAPEEEMTKYKKALEKKGLIVLTGDLRVMQTGAVWVLAKFENIYFL